MFGCSFVIQCVFSLFEQFWKIKKEWRKHKDLRKKGENRGGYSVNDVQNKVVVYSTRN
jgi:hypothetical protein